MSAARISDVTDEKWDPKAIVMKENIEHHIEEEEGEMFAKAHQVFDRSGQVFDCRFSIGAVNA